jgi:murein DD-endopeptidase MepM/ murein hydrolase activator NlpD
LSAIGAVSPLAPTDSVIGPAARAFAPVAPVAPTVAAGPQKPRPIDDPRTQPILGPQAAAERGVGADLLAAANNPDLDAAARLSLISVSLDSTERRQATAVGEIAADARAGAAKLSAVVARAGLAADTLVAPAAKGGVGGPFIPLSVDPAAPAFDKALASAARDVAAADRLSRLLPILPVRAPLIGEAAVSSPFGYRTDPFLGRPELHPGVDLVQDYGSEIRATAGGRVTHAGPMSGYGDMVEVDHGNGLVTRYGHLSEILVDEGQAVTAGALLGRLGSTGRSTGPHLHYEVRVDGEPVDPERFLAAGAPLFGTPL